MKFFSSLTAIIVTLAAMSHAQKGEIKKQWIDLSAKVQNTYDEFNLLKDSSPDPETLLKAVSEIDTALDRLVTAGELRSHTIEIKIPDSKNAQEYFEKKIAPLKASIKDIGKTYGIHTASEMGDLGARFYVNTIKSNSIVKMHIRLPEKEMKAYLAKVKKTGIITKIPTLPKKTKSVKATKLYSYNDGDHWFIVDSFARRVQLIIHSLDTAEKYSHLPYKFGSADPSNGGFDCSGATSYVLKKTGLKPPRTSAQQFIWIRDKGKIRLIGKTIRSVSDPAFRTILPGDLVFWSGTYTPTDGRTVNISHVGIYLGTEKDGRHIMACATNGRSYRGKKGNGFGIYDFKIPRKNSKATFIGYGSPL